MAENIICKLTGENDSFFGQSAAPIFLAMQLEAEQLEDMSALNKVFWVNKSESFAEKLISKTSMKGFMPVGEGGAYPKDDFREGYSQTLYHETFKDQFTITREMVDDNKVLEMNSEALGFTAGYLRTREMFGAAILGSGTGSTVTFRGKSFDTTCADGRPLFSDEHPSITNSYREQSNLFADEFSADTLAAAEAAMQNFRDDNGAPLSIVPDTIIIPNNYKLKQRVFSVLGADKDPDTSNNGFNFTFGRYNIIVWGYLNDHVDEGTWYLLDSHYNQTRGGLVWFDRQVLEVTPWIDHNNDNYIWNGYARWSAGANNWRAIAVGGQTGGTKLIV